MDITLGNVLVTYHDGYLRTILPTGEIVHAIAHHDESYAATARRLGYLDVEMLNRDHDLVHSLLAHWLGMPCSPALQAAASGARDTELTGAEEDAVMAIQRFANLAGIDLTLIPQVRERRLG